MIDLIAIALAGTAAPTSPPGDTAASLRALILPYLQCDRRFDQRRVALERRRDELYREDRPTPEATARHAEQINQTAEELRQLQVQIAAECRPEESFERLRARIATWPSTYSEGQTESFAMRVFHQFGEFERQLADHRLGRFSGYVVIPAPPPPPLPHGEVGN